MCQHDRRVLSFSVTRVKFTNHDSASFVIKRLDIATAVAPMGRHQTMKIKVLFKCRSLIVCFCLRWIAFIHIWSLAACNSLSPMSDVCLIEHFLANDRKNNQALLECLLLHHLSFCTWVFMHLIYCFLCGPSIRPIHLGVFFFK